MKAAKMLLPGLFISLFCVYLPCEGVSFMDFFDMNSSLFGASDLSTAASTTGAAATTPGVPVSVTALEGATPEASTVSTIPESVNINISSASVEPWLTNWKFRCDRPTSSCDPMQGMCDPNTGTCNCINQAFGLQCQAADINLQNSGECLMSNPCQHGICYDDGVSAKCSCPDGYYGDKCQHPMVQVECGPEKMVINVFPYGYSDLKWSRIPLPSTQTCALQTMDTFLVRKPAYIDKRWDGFAGEFLHTGDPCAEDATLDTSFLTSQKVYSRTIYVYYGENGVRDKTDTAVTVSCQVAGVVTTAAPLDPRQLPPKVNIQMLNRLNGAMITGPVDLGSSVLVQFSVNPLNNANVDRVRVEMCTVDDGINSQNLVIVDHSCAVPPMGQMLYLDGSGADNLALLMHRFPFSQNVNFKCTLRLCDSAKTSLCVTTRYCQRRKKRDASQLTRDPDSLVDVNFQTTY